MNPLRTTVVMKTDISGSTARFHQLLAADLQALLSEHRDFLARHAAEHDGRIMKGAGDGYWLEFPSVTGAAKAAIAMQESRRRPAGHTHCDRARRYRRSGWRFHR
jgi:class 3 adenylate cyclase